MRVKLNLINWVIFFIFHSSWTDFPSMAIYQYVYLLAVVFVFVIYTVFAAYLFLRKILNTLQPSSYLQSSILHSTVAHRTCNDSNYIIVEKLKKNNEKQWQKSSNEIFHFYSFFNYLCDDWYWHNNCWFVFNSISHKKQSGPEVHDSVFHKVC